MEALSKQQEETVTVGLGAACLGLGLTFALFPGLMNKLAGLNAAKEPESRMLIRLVGMRDIALGLGLLTNSSNREVAQSWRNSLALVAGSDVAVFGLMLPKSKNKFMTLLAMATSGVITALALRK